LLIIRNRLDTNDTTRPNTNNKENNINNNNNNNNNHSGKNNSITTPKLNNVQENRDKFAGRIVTRAIARLKKLPETSENIVKRNEIKSVISSVTKTNISQIKVYLDSFSKDNGITFQDSEEALEWMPK